MYKLTLHLKARLAPTTLNKFERMDATHLGILTTDDDMEC